MIQQCWAICKVAPGRGKKSNRNSLGMVLNVAYASMCVHRTEIRVAQIDPWPLCKSPEWAQNCVRHTRMNTQQQIIPIYTVIFAVAIFIVRTFYRISFTINLILVSYHRFSGFACIGSRDSKTQQRHIFTRIDAMRINYAVLNGSKCSCTRGDSVRFWSNVINGNLCNYWNEWKYNKNRLYYIHAFINSSERRAQSLDAIFSHLVQLKRAYGKYEHMTVQQELAMNS